MSTVVLAALLTLAASTASAGEGVDEPSNGKAKRTDFYGDPLPEGAIARLGSSQLRHTGASMRFSPDGKQLVSWASDHLVRTWDVESGKLLRQESLKGVNPASHGWFLVGDKIVQIVEQTLHVCDSTTGKELRKLAHTEKIAIERSAASADARLAAVFFRDDTLNEGSIYLWNLETGEERTFAKVGVATQLAFSRDAKILVASGVSGAKTEIRFWDVASGKQVHKLETEALCFALALDGTTLATGTFQGLVRLWDLPTGKELAILAHSSKPQFSCLEFSPDGKWLAAGGADDLRLWNVETRKQVHDFAGNSADALAFSPDSKRLVSFGGARLHIWDIATGKDLHPRPGHGGMAIYHAFSPEGKVTASSASGDSWIRLWDTVTGKPLGNLKGHERQPCVYSFTPDGERFVSAAYDGTVRIWDVGTRKEVRSFHVKGASTTKHPGDALNAFLSPDGKHLSAVTRAYEKDGTKYQIESWDAETGKLLFQRPFLGNQGSDLRRMAEASVAKRDKGS